MEIDIARLRAWCDARGIPTEIDASGRQLAIPVQGARPVVVLSRDERGMVTFLSAFPFTVSDGDRDEYCRALALLNSASYMGAFVLNSQTGETYFRLTVLSRGTTMTDDAVGGLLEVVVSSVAGTTAALRGVATEGLPYTTVLPRNELV